MKEKYFINARIIDPSQNLDEIGGLIIDPQGKIKAVGKSVKKLNIPTKAEKIDLKVATVRAGVSNIFANPHKGSYYVAVVSDKIVSCLLTLFLLDFASIFPNIPRFIHSDRIQIKDVSFLVLRNFAFSFSKMTYSFSCFDA